MIIGLPKEIKNSEFRVGLTDQNVANLYECGHQIWVQKGAGLGSGLTDESYVKAGAKLVDDLEEVYAKSEMIIKVKEPLDKEYKLFKENQILFTFLHLAPEPKLTSALCSRGVRALAYETIENKEGELPLLKPMSQVAGRVGLQNGIYYLQKFTGGKGLLPGGIPGAKKAMVTILGGGNAGLHSAMMALGVCAKVRILEICPHRLKKLNNYFQGKVELLISNKENLRSSLKNTDIFIGSILLTGHKAPKLITEEMIQEMEKQSVAVDISIDQGGCMETSRPSSHTNPIYQSHGIIHYCVPNIPSAVAQTSTYALTNVSFPYIKEIANKGFENSLKDNPLLKKGLNVYKGFVSCLPVAKALNREYKSPEDLGL